MTQSQITFLIISYLISSIPFGFIISKIIAKKDIRKFGSKNIGATNVTRILGKKWGYITFILDGLKAGIMIILAKNILILPFYNNNFLCILVFTCVIGHIFPIYLKFKGGKGVATAMIALFALNPMIGIINAIFWLIVFYSFKISFISSLISILLTTLYVIFADYYEESFLLLALSILIIIRHKQNIIEFYQKNDKNINN